MSIKLYTVRVYTGAWILGEEVNYGYDVLAADKVEAMEIGFEKYKKQHDEPARMVEAYVSPWEKVRHEDAAMMEAGVGELSWMKKRKRTMKKHFETMALYNGAVVIEGVVYASSEAEALDICRKGLEENNSSVEASNYGMIFPADKCRFVAVAID